VPHDYRVDGAPDIRGRAGPGGGIFNARELAEGGQLARGVCAYIAVFWGVRLALQAVFDVKEHLTAWWLKAGYFALSLLFAGFTLVYALASLAVGS
jgi:hypothetical protein